jgi:hypothetical protein
MKEDEGGGTRVVREVRTCSTHGGWERCLQGFGWEARREESTEKI